MKRPRFLKEFKLETYSIPVKDEYFEQAFGTASLTVLENAVQETSEGNALVFRKSGGPTIWETKQVELANSGELSPSDIMVDLAIRTGFDTEESGKVLQELLLKNQATVTIDNELLPKDISEEEKEALHPKTIYLKDFYSAEELKEIRQVKKSLYSGDRLFPAVLLFLNNRIVDMETNQVVKFKFTEEQVLSLPSELYLEVVKFVGLEMNGYPEDVPEESDIEIIAKPEKKEAVKK